jgi:hypothetical protein
MEVDTPVSPKRSAIAFLLLVALLIVLTVSRELPLTDDTIGVPRLVLKTRWATASILFRYVGVLPGISARQLVALDPWLESEEATAGAVWLASYGRPAERLRWSSDLTLQSPAFAQLLRQAIDASLQSGGVDCDAVKHAHQAVARLPPGSRQRKVLQTKVRSLARSLAGRPVQARNGASQAHRLRSVPCRLP